MSSTPNSSQNVLFVGDDLQTTGQPLTPSLFVAAIWRAKNLGYSILAASLLVAALIIAFRQPVFVATAIIEPPLVPGSQMSGTSQMLASFAGIDPTGTTGQFTKYLQVIGSPRFAARLEQNHGVMKHLIAGWDEQTHSWKAPSGPIAFVKENLKSLLGLGGQVQPDASSLSEVLQKKIAIGLIPGKSPLDLKSQVFSVSVTLPDRNYAQALLAWSLRTADDIVREDQLERTINRVAYLKQTMITTDEIYLRQSLQQILTSQEQTLMTLKTDKYYSVDLVDPPSVPQKPAGVAISTLLILSVFLGLIFYVLVVFVIVFRRTRSAKGKDEDVLSEPFPDPVNVITGYTKRISGRMRGGRR